MPRTPAVALSALAPRLMAARYNVSGVGSTVLWDKTKSEQLWTAIRDDQPVPAFSGT